MTISFNYKVVQRPDKTKVKTPSIPVTLGGAVKIDTVALIDSGADISAMSRDMAEIIGLDLSGTPSSAYGIGGKTKAVDTKMSIEISKGHENYKFRIPVKVIMGNYDFPVLLGRVGFFDKFTVSFKQQENKVSLKRVSNRY